jgi:hypothetical protein
MPNIRELYQSRTETAGASRMIPIPGACFVKHEANRPSGGHIAEIEIGAFLSQGNGPEKQGLLRLIATLVGVTGTPKKAQGAPKPKRTSSVRIIRKRGILTGSSRASNHHFPSRVTRRTAAVLLDPTW